LAGATAALQNNRNSWSEHLQDFIDMGQEQSTAAAHEEEADMQTDQVETDQVARRPTSGQLRDCRFTLLLMTKE